MKIMVTGGSGFIGSHIVDLLLDHHYEVVVVDNLSTGDSNHLNQRVPFYETDINSKDLEDIFQLEQPDMIIHQAAQVDVQTSIHNPLYDAQVNILGTMNLLENARKHNVKKFIYASSCAAYGEPQTNPVREKHPRKPISLYGNSKWLGEHCILVYHRLYQMEYTILRYANVYGPRQGTKGEGGVVSIFLQNLQQGKPITIYGDGTQTRDFVYVKDVARANMLAIVGGANSILNISTGKPTSINELVKKIKKITGTPIAPEYNRKRAGDIEHSCLDPSKAAQLLNWKALYTLDEGLAETVQYFISRGEG